MRDIIHEDPPSAVPLSGAGPASENSLALEHYRTLRERVAEGRTMFQRPLTLAEKVLVAHLRRRDVAPPVRGATYVDLDPDRVALQDALAQIVALQFITAGLDEVVVPTTVHCDHLITARTNATIDLRAAKDTNAEVYDFLRSVCARFGIGFWEPGAGIIHQVVLENYAFPGGLMIGTDSHTPNAGGLAMVAVGVGGGDAIDVMTGLPFNLRWPRLIGVRLTGELSGWSSPKDVILRVADLLTVSGGTGAIVEYFGPGTADHQRHGQGHDLQHGGRDRRHDVDLPLRRRDVVVPARHVPGRGRGRRRRRRRRPARRPRDRRRPRSVLRPGHRDRPLGVATEDQRPRHSGPQPRARRRRDLGAPARRADVHRRVARGIVHQLLLRGHRQGGVGGAPRARVGAPREDAAPGHARVGADSRDRRTRRIPRRPRRDWRDGPRQRLRSVHRPVGPPVGRPHGGEHDRDQLQPQFRAAQRRQRRDQGVPRLTRGRRRVGARRARSTSIPRTTTIEIDDGRRVRLSTPRRRGPAARRDSSVPPRRRGRRPTRRVPIEVSPTSTTAAAPGAVPRVGRRGLRGAAGARQGRGQVHDRPDLGGRSVAQLPRAPRTHLRQPVPGRRQRLHRRDRRREAIPSTVRRDRIPSIAKHLSDAGRRLVRRRRRQLRRRFLAGARGDGAALPGMVSSSSRARSRESTRPT